MGILYLRSTASGVVTGNANIHQLSTAIGSAAINDGTSFNPVISTNYNVGPGTRTIQTPNGTISGNGQGWIWDTQPNQTIPAGVWTVNFDYTSTTASCLNPVAAFIAEVYNVTASSSAVTSVALIGTANTGSMSLTANVGDQSVSATFNGGATTFSAGDYIYVQYFYESGNPHASTYANRADQPTIALAGQVDFPNQVVFDPPFTQYGLPSILAQ